MTASSARTKAARMLRRIGDRRGLPDWAWFPVQRLAFVVSPHALTCRICGERFVQPAFGSKVHAARAYAHYVDAHEEVRS